MIFFESPLIFQLFSLVCQYRHSFKPLRPPAHSHPPLVFATVPLQPTQKWLHQNSSISSPFLPSPFSLVPSVSPLSTPSLLANNIWLVVPTVTMLLPRGSALQSKGAAKANPLLVLLLPLPPVHQQQQPQRLLQQIQRPLQPLNPQRPVLLLLVEVLPPLRVGARLVLLGPTVTIPRSNITLRIKSNSKKTPVQKRKSIHSALSSLYTWSPDIPQEAINYGLTVAPMLWGYNQIDDFQTLVVAGYASYVLGMNECVSTFFFLR
jgi:hypothetical protein